MTLSGKVAVVTGSGRGLGLAYATELARGGASVVINDVDGAVAASAVKAITEGGGAAVAEVVPVGTSDAAQALVDRAVSTFGRLDVLVNNAGILRDATLWKMTDEQFDAVISTHLRGTFTCTRAAAIRMREQGEGGRIICVGSPTGQLGNFGQGNYAAAKAGIVGMVRTWALELARAQITVNAIVPVAATAMTETIPFLKPYVEALHAGEPLPSFARRELGFGSPEDAAGLVAFLASDAAAGISGQAIGIGGDRLVLWSHPSEAVVAFAEGSGWSPDAIAEAWPEQFAPAQQPVGQQFPEPPTMSTPTVMDLDALVAIDVHVHVNADLHGHLALDDELGAAASKYFKGDPYDPTVHDIASDYRTMRDGGSHFHVDAEAATGHRALSNEEIAEAAAAHPDVLIPFASIDPARGKAGIRAARRLGRTARGSRASSSIRACRASCPTTRRRLPAV